MDEKQTGVVNALKLFIRKNPTQAKTIKNALEKQNLNKNAMKQLFEGNLNVTDEELKVICTIIKYDYEKAKNEIMMIKSESMADKLKNMLNSNAEIISVEGETGLQKVSGDEYSGDSSSNINNESKNQDNTKDKNKQNSKSKLNLLKDTISPDEYDVDDIIELLEDKNEKYVAKFKMRENVDNGINADLELENVTEAGEHEYLATVPYKWFAEKWLYNELYYNSMAQRGLKNSGKAVSKTGKIKDIAECIAKGTMVMPEITVGLLNDGQHELIYDEDGNLMFDGLMFLIDGQHRVRGIFGAYVESLINSNAGINLEKLVNVKFKYVTMKQAGEIFVQLSQATPISKTRIAALQVDEYTELVKRLERESTLKGKINYTSNILSSKDLVSFKVLDEAIRTKITELNKFNREEEFEFLRDCFDYLAYRLPDYFGNNEGLRTEKKEHSMLNQNNSFYAFLDIFYADKEKYQENINNLVAIEKEGKFEKEALDSNNEMIWKECLKTARNGGWAIKSESGIKGIITEVFRKLMGWE